MGIKFSRTFLSWLAAALVVSTAPMSLAFADFKVEQVAPGVYLHYGIHEQITLQNQGDIANIGFIVGEKSVAVIDTGGSKQVGADLKKAVEQITELPIRYVILTHAHPDHIFGVGAFSEDDIDIEIVGHHRLSNALVQRGAFYQQRFIQEQGFLAEELELVAPTLLVDSELKLDLGNRNLILTAQKTAHTDNDLTVYDEKTKTFWTGDLLFNQRVPVLDGNAKGWLTVMQQLKEVEVDLIIPGHGQISNNWSDALVNQRQYLNNLVTEIREMLAKGLSIQSAIQDAGRNEREKWQLYDDHHGQNVSRIYTELEWE